MNHIEFIVQAVVAVFAVVTAFHDAPAVQVFRYHGVSNKEMAQFHRYNVWLKFLFCVVAALAAGPKLVTMIFTGLVCATWVYLLFDIAINVRTGKKWSYISIDNANGRTWYRWFWKSAGQVKAALLLLAIAALNFIYLKFFY